MTILKETVQALFDECKIFYTDRRYYYAAKEEALFSLEKFENILLGEVTEEKIIAFLKTRSFNVSHSYSCYTAIPTDPITVFCEALAHLLDKEKIGHYRFLFHNLEYFEDQLGLCGPIQNYSLGQLILSDDGKSLIPISILGWIIHEGGKRNLIRPYHPSKGKHDTQFLTASEYNRLVTHSSSDLQRFIKIYNSYNAYQWVNGDIGHHLEALQKALTKGRVNTDITFYEEQGSGAEMDAGGEAYEGIAVFYEYWNSLEETTKAEYLTLFKGAEDILTIISEDNKNLNNTRYCINGLRKNLSLIINRIKQSVYPTFFEELSLAAQSLPQAFGFVVNQRPAKKIGLILYKKYSSFQRDYIFEEFHHLNDEELKEWCNYLSRVGTTEIFTFIHFLLQGSPKEKTKEVIESLKGRIETTLRYDSSFFIFLLTLDQEKNDIVIELFRTFYKNELEQPRQLANFLLKLIAKKNHWLDNFLSYPPQQAYELGLDVTHQIRTKIFKICSPQLYLATGEINLELFNQFLDKTNQASLFLPLLENKKIWEAYLIFYNKHRGGRWAIEVLEHIVENLKQAERLDFFDSIYEKDYKIGLTIFSKTQYMKEFLETSQDHLISRLDTKSLANFCGSLNSVSYNLLISYIHSNRHYLPNEVDLTFACQEYKKNNDREAWNSLYPSLLTKGVVSTISLGLTSLIFQGTVIMEFPLVVMLAISILLASPISLIPAISCIAICGSAAIIICLIAATFGFLRDNLSLYNRTRQLEKLENSLLIDTHIVKKRIENFTDANFKNIVRRYNEPFYKRYGKVITFFTGGIVAGPSDSTLALLKTLNSNHLSKEIKRNNLNDFFNNYPGNLGKRMYACIAEEASFEFEKNRNMNIV